MEGVSHDAVVNAARPPDRPVSFRRRMLAVAALAVTPLGVLVVLLGFVLGFPVLLLALVALVLAVASIWAAMGRRGVRRVLWGIAAVGLLGSTVVLVVISRRPSVVLLAGLAVVALGLSAAGAALLHAPRRGGPPEPRRVETRPARPVLFVNPRSGDGTSERVDLPGEARRRGIEVVLLDGDLDLRAEARRWVGEGADCLLAAGGDGTLAQVAEVAIEADLPFVVVPAGTRNHFALDLGLDRGDPVAALDAVVDAVERNVDVGEVNGRMFLNNVSVGAYGEVVADEQYRERKVGTTLAKLPSLIGPDAEPLDLQFIDEHGEEHDTAILVMVSNNSYALTPRAGFGTRPSLYDGKLGVVAILPSAGLAPPVRVLRWEAPEFRLDSGADIAAGLDGEAEELDAPARFRIRAGVLRVRLPIHCVGASPAERRPRLTKRTFLRILDLAMGHVPQF
jgi:diacylglycerol kinase family enzyme